jgi:hypothetical protein
MDYLLDIVMKKDYYPFLCEIMIYYRDKGNP